MHRYGRKPKPVYVPRERIFTKFGAEVHEIFTPSFYTGSTEYEITGNFGQVAAVVEWIRFIWPPDPYCFNTNWPPYPWRDKPSLKTDPVYLGGCKWVAHVRHSNSSD